MPIWIKQIVDQVKIANAFCNLQLHMKECKKRSGLSSNITLKYQAVDASQSLRSRS